MASLLLHAALVLLYFALPAKFEKNNPRPVRIEILEVPKKALQPPEPLIRRGRSSSGSRRTLGHGGGTIAAQDLGGYLPRYKFDHYLTDSGGDTYSHNPNMDNPGAEWGSGAGTFGRIKDYNFFRVFYSHIDSSLAYPGVLARHKITGTVQARVVVDRNGSCDWQRTKIEGQNGYLGLYVLDVLKRVCQMNFKQYIGDREVTNADLSFKFDINENDDWQRVEKEKFIVGNTLLFYRNSHQTVMEWELGPFRGMFPIPMIYLNLPWLQENWDSLVNKKEPLKEFKKQYGEVVET